MTRGHQTLPTTRTRHWTMVLSVFRGPSHQQNGALILRPELWSKKTSVT